MKKIGISCVELRGFKFIMVIALFIFSASAKALPPITPFITSWQTDASKIIQIPLNGSGYDFIIDWGDAATQSISGSPGNISHTYTTAGTYTITITPNTATGFPRIYVNNFANRNNLKTVAQWGTGQWAAMDRAFFGAATMDITATDVPDLSMVTSFDYMFMNCTVLTNSNGSMANWVFTTDPAKSISMVSMFQSANAFNQNINGWNVQRVTNMSSMFNSTQVFNQPLDSWNVSSVTNMSSMFTSTQAFNQPLNSWNVSAVTSMNSMFNNARVFNQPLNGWGATTVNVVDMSSMFQSTAKFNQDISGWDVSNVTNMAYMFYAAAVFNSPLNGWGAKTGKVTNMSNMFRQTPLFNQPIDGWDVSKVTNTNLMFYQANSFNQDLNSWDVSSLVNPNQMFQNAAVFNGNISNWRFTTDPAKSINMTSMFQSTPKFNQDISGWNVSRVTTMNSMFNSAQAFNQDINSWDVSNVTDMSAMFASTTAFNQNIGSWNLSKVTNMNSMFSSSQAFNQSLNSWNVSTVTSMNSMFNNARVFNQPLNGWGATTVNVRDMSSMFQSAAKFDQDISGWDVSNVTNMGNMFFAATVFNSPLNGWGSKTGKVTNMSGMFRQTPLFNQPIDGWDVSKVTSTSFMFSQTNSFNQDLNSWNVSSLVNPNQMFQNALVFNGNITGWAFTTDPAKSINMTAMFQSTPKFNQDISGWNVSRVTTMNSMFNGAQAFNQDINNWDVSKVTDMSSMFNSAGLFNQDISGWNVSSVTNMSSMFANTPLFNKNISSWNVSNVTSMNSMFSGAAAFDQPLTWGVKTLKVTDMSSMFQSAAKFDQDISGWDVSNVTNMGNMFFAAAVFNSPLNGWGSKTGKVTNMSGMFRQTPLFNQPIDGWNVSKVTNTSLMFYQANSFNQDLNSWNISSLVNPNQMFQNALVFNGNISNWTFTSDPLKSVNMSSMFNSALAFNQDIGRWNMKRVTNVNSMFQSASAFNQNISGWDISNITNAVNFLNGGKLSRANYDTLLKGWSSLDSGETKIPVNLNINFGSSKYSNVTAVVNARSFLTPMKNWTITDGGTSNDFTSPTILGNTLALNDSTITVTFSERVYNNNRAGGNLDVNDFSFSLTGGAATLSSATPISISTTDNISFTLGIGLTGIPNGAETVTVNPVISSVYDIDGNEASTTQTNNTATLYDLAPAIITGPGSASGATSSISIAENQSGVFTFTASETVNWSLGTGADESLFTISNGGLVNFAAPPDYEIPLSTNSNNIYLIKVMAEDGNGNISMQTVTITVTDVAPAVLSGFPSQTRTTFDAPYVLTTPASSSTGAFTYSSSNGAVATISGSTVTITGAGTTTITAIQAFDATYDQSTISSTLTVNSVNVLTKNGEITSSSTNFVNKNGAIYASNGINSNGRELVTFSGQDGLTAAKASTSAYEIKQSYPSSPDGYYWIKNSNINNGNPFQIYADMTTDGGGWTLIMCNASNAGWAYGNAISLNTASPSINSNYSIIGWADYIKRSATGFQYMIDANARGTNGGIWTANGAYTFLSANNTQTDITINTKFGTWTYNDAGIEQIMPWYSNCSGAITTSNDCGINWGGTLVSLGGSNPAPWIGGGCGVEGCMTDPGIIWYWVR